MTDIQNDDLLTLLRDPRIFWAGERVTELVERAAKHIESVESVLVSEHAARTAAEATIAQVKAELDRYDQSDESEEYRECAPEDRWRLYRDLDTILASYPPHLLDAQVEADDDAAKEAD